MESQCALEAKVRRRTGATLPEGSERQQNPGSGVQRNPRIPKPGRQALNNLFDETARRTPWGIAASFDIYNCNPGTIRDAEKIRRFVAELCRLIDMKRFGDTTVVHFGEDERVAGFSMIQLIETSLVSAHFANQSNTTYLDVFSCKPYDPAVVKEFALRYFEGSRCITHVNLRL